MKKLLTGLFCFAIGLSTAFGQCSIVPFSLQKKVYDADVVVEAKVLSKSSFWNAERNFIYTKNVLHVSTIFKGNNMGKEITLITEGGTIGMDALVVEPSLQLDVNEIGIFLLKSAELKLETSFGHCYQPVASVQSFIKYDLIDVKALGYFEIYEDIKGDLFPKIEKYASQSRIQIDTDPLGIGSVKPLATPVISSIDKDTVTAGTGTLLTITGSAFGIIKGGGYVEFLDPNYGDGRYFPVYYPTSYKSWSNSKIEVYIPGRAGTGKIRVVNNSSESTTSSDELYVRFAHSNYAFPGGNGADSGFHQIKHVDISGNGGYRWQMTHNFAKNTPAVNAFFRAAENWRCNTLMNWDVGNDTTAAGAVKDDINVVQFTRFGDSRLGVCASWYSGCVSGGIAYFHVSELDISFDSTRNWYYGTTKPGASQYDFETVATHELGHGQQLGHVIDTKKIMHYSLSNGDRNTTLHAHDIEGGGYVRDNSKTGTVCFGAKYKAIDVDDCNITRPKAKISANFSTPCPNTSVKLTNETEGKVTAYDWSFGLDASVASATGEGPYNISYSSSGEKTVQLIATNDFGSDTATLKINVQPGTPDTPAVFVVDTACLGEAMYSIMSVPDATSYTWSVGSGGAVSGSNSDTAVMINWTTDGTHDVSVTAKNVCGTSDPRTIQVVVLEPAVADFDFVNDNGLTVDFEDLSTSARTRAWNFGDGNISLDTNPSNTYTSRATYDVSLTVTNACSDSTLTQGVEVNFKTSVNEIDNTELTLVPNPASTFIALKSVQGVGVVNVLIMNDLGQTVKEFNEVHEGYQMDVSKLTSGVYFYTIESVDGNNYAGKLLIR